MLAPMSRLTQVFTGRELSDPSVVGFPVVGSTDMGDVSQLMPVIHPYVVAASGIGHGSDYLVHDYDHVGCVCVRAKERIVEMSMKSLIIAEKPSVAQDIVRALTPVSGKFEKHADHFENERYVVTSAVGRAWCGYACPQTVWTDLFVHIERFIEGDRNAQIRLQKAPWGPEKIAKRVSKHTLWLLIAVATGGDPGPDPMRLDP